jgi:hypothetical protein
MYSLLQNANTIVSVAQGLAKAAKSVGYTGLPNFQHDHGYRRPTITASAPSVKRPAAAPMYAPQDKRKRYNKKRFETGRWAGRFKKKRGRNARRLYGYVKARTEHVGEVVGTTASIPAWFGATAMTGKRVGRMLCLAALQRLAGLMGRSFTNENVFIDATANNGGTFHYRINSGGELAFFDRTVSIGLGDTWAVLASNWLNDLDGTPIVDSLNFIECYIVFKDDDAVPSTLGSGPRLDMTEMLVDYKIDCTVRIQNRTGANSSAELDTDLVDVNPILGRIYVLKGSTPVVNLSTDSSVTTTLDSDNTSGLITLNAADATMNDGIANLFKRVQSPNIFRNVKRSNGLKLQPGEIKYVKESAKGKAYFDTFFRCLVNPTLNLTANPSTRNTNKMGKCLMFGFEKAMRTGTGTAPITLGYMINQYHTFKCIAKKKKPYIMECDTV